MRSTILAFAVAWLVTQPASGRTFWVLQAPDHIVEYDAATFTMRRSVPVPQRVFQPRGSLAVNAHGHLLFSADDLVWFWDGRTARELQRDAGPGTSRQWFLSAAGDALLALERRVAIERDADGAERFIRVSTQIVRTDLSGNNAQPVLTLPDLPRCECGTGACSETCPIWMAWAPGQIVGNFVAATRYVEGQLQPEFQQSVIHRRQGRTWIPINLPSPVEVLLDASGTADVLVEAIFDSGCCGWLNESSDQLVVFRQGNRLVVYDEWERFDNRNYDATFAASTARLSPSGTRLAYGVTAYAPRPDEALRLSADGKPNPDELGRIRTAIAEHPVVEIIDLAGREPRARIPGAELVGWLDADRILVAQQGRLVSYDRRGGRQRETELRVRNAADAFLR